MSKLIFLFSLEKYARVIHYALLITNQTIRKRFKIFKNKSIRFTQLNPCKLGLFHSWVCIGESLYAEGKRC